MAVPERSEDRRPFLDSARELAVQAARIQLASATAASRFLTGWMQSADRYAERVSDDLVGRMHGEFGSGDLARRLSEATDVHVRELTTLPAVAIDHFNHRVATTQRETKRP